MSQVHEFSDEFINAFVDNQVTPEEKKWIYAHLASSEAFNRRVCELRKIRDLIRLAYQELSTPGQNRATPSVKAAGQCNRNK
jgi:anti-sigma factor RsiW